MTTSTTTRSQCPTEALGRAFPSRFERGPRHGSLRLTRRGRVLVVLLALGLLLVAGFAAGRVSSSHAAPATTATAVVQPGDTLWSIAARVAPERDTRAVVRQIRAANHLSSASVQVGQRLTLPA
ncbi:MAG: LysM peptidoglycan-binding domain-containing protein [Mycobacteriales bacterium]